MAGTVGAKGRAPDEGAAAPSRGAKEPDRKTLTIVFSSGDWKNQSEARMRSIGPFEFKVPRCRTPKLASSTPKVQLQGAWEPIAKTPESQSLCGNFSPAILEAQRSSLELARDGEDALHALRFTYPHMAAAELARVEKYVIAYGIDDCQVGRSLEEAARYDYIAVLYDGDHRLLFQLSGIPVDPAVTVARSADYVEAMARGASPQDGARGWWQAFGAIVKSIRPIPPKQRR